MEITLVGKITGTTLVSECDYKRVSEYSWHVRGKYVTQRALGALHHFIIGERPADVPDDYVVDHINRLRFDNRRENLRWVSQSFNTWNTEIKGESKYKGVSKNVKWVATFRGKNIGLFEDERDAGARVAKAAVAEFGEWAETSDLLTKNFSSEDIAEFKREGYIPKPPRALPRGVFNEGLKYKAQYAKIRIGVFREVEDAKKAYDTYVKNLNDKAWEEHIKKPVTVDSDGHAIIPLTGSGVGKVTKVPAQFWHKLTFKTSWFLDNEAYAAGRYEGPTLKLHAVVWALLHPDDGSRKGVSIDHIVPENKLDNREENLRLATPSDQMRNQCKRGKGRYRGVSYNSVKRKWRGEVFVNGTSYRTSYYESEHEAARQLNALRLKHLGPNATLNTIIEDAETDAGPSGASKD